MAGKYKQKQELIKAEINEFMKLDLLSNAKNDETLEQMLSTSPLRMKQEKSISEISNKTAKQLRDEIKQRKNQLRNVARVQATSKIGLSKMVTSLEKQTQEDEKKIEILNHKLSQAAKEKQMFKQKYETLKTQVKTNETDDIKLIKTISLETRDQYREKYNKSPYARNKQKPEGGPPLKSLQQARKERKKEPLYSSREGKSSREDKSPFTRSERAKGKVNKTPQRLYKNMQKNSFEDDGEYTQEINRSSMLVLFS